MLRQEHFVRELAVLERMAFVQEIMRRNWMNLNHMRREVIVQPIINVMQPVIAQPVIQPVVVVLSVQTTMAGPPPDFPVKSEMQIMSSCPGVLEAPMTQQTSGQELTAGNPVLVLPSRAVETNIPIAASIAVPLEATNNGLNSQQEMLSQALPLGLTSQEIQESEELGSRPTPLIRPHFIPTPIPVVMT